MKEYKMNNKISKKMKELGELCVKEDRQFFLSIDGYSEPAWHTLGKLEDVDVRLHKFTDQINDHLKDVSNDCIRIAYKNKDEQWVIKD